MLHEILASHSVLNDFFGYVQHHWGEHTTAYGRSFSAALLEDLLQGSSYRALHALFDAMQSGYAPAIHQAVRALLQIGASSGGDMLAGVLLTLLNPELPAKRP